MTQTGDARSAAAALPPDMVNTRSDVAGLMERLRLAEAKLARQRQAASGMNRTDRAAMRAIIECSDAGTPTTPSRLAAHLDISPGSATALVDRLAAGGFVTVSPHASDRRKKLIIPFDRTLHADHIDPLTSSIRALASTLDTEEAAVITRFLQRVLDEVTDPSKQATQKVEHAAEDPE